jgi:hypothetical protein
MSTAGVERLPILRRLVRAVTGLGKERPEFAWGHVDVEELVGDPPVMVPGAVTVNTGLFYVEDALVSLQAYAGTEVRDVTVEVLDQTTNPGEIRIYVHDVSSASVSVSTYTGGLPATVNMTTTTTTTTTRAQSDDTCTVYWQAMGRGGAHRDPDF